MPISEQQLQVFLNSHSNAEVLPLETVVNDVIVSGIASTTRCELSLEQDVIPKMLENKEAMTFVLAKLIQGDISAVKELRMLAKSAAREKISQWANH